MWRIIFAEIERASALNDVDLILLVANYTDIVTGDRHKVSNAVHGRGYTKEQIATVQDEARLKFNPVAVCGLKFTRPFETLKFPQLGYLLTMFEAFEKGNLPFPGSTSEQPAQIMEMFSVLKQLKHEFESKAREEQRKRQEHANRHRK